jgi:hypothetical protein
MRTRNQSLIQINKTIAKEIVRKNSINFK